MNITVTYLEIHPIYVLSKDSLTFEIKSSNNLKPHIGIINKCPRLREIVCHICHYSRCSNDPVSISDAKSNIYSLRVTKSSEFVLPSILQQFRRIRVDVIDVSKIKVNDKVRAMVKENRKGTRKENLDEAHVPPHFPSVNFSIIDDIFNSLKKNLDGSIDNRDMDISVYISTAVILGQKESEECRHYPETYSALVAFKNGMLNVNGLRDIVFRVDTPFGRSLMTVVDDESVKVMYEKAHKLGDHVSSVDISVLESIMSLRDFPAWKDLPYLEEKDEEEEEYDYEEEEDRLHPIILNLLDEMMFKYLSAFKNLREIVIQDFKKMPELNVLERFFPRRMKKNVRKLTLLESHYTLHIDIGYMTFAAGDTLTTILSIWQGHVNVNVSNPIEEESSLILEPIYEILGEVVAEGMRKVMISFPPRDGSSSETLQYPSSTLVINNL